MREPYSIFAFSLVCVSGLILSGCGGNSASTEKVTLPNVGLLSQVGPIDPANGFPLWYQDANALTLQHCLSQTGFCFTAEPNPALPISFPDNFGDEAFYFRVLAKMNLPSGGLALLALAVESSFLNGVVVNGDQIAFSRIRIRVDTPAPGTYRVIHPYGDDTFVNVPAGLRAINFTEDVGRAVAGDFAALLSSRVGPFLKSTTGTVVDALGEVYLANPNILTTVTGSPTGNNKFRIEGPGIGGPGVDFIETNQFQLMGKVFAAAAPPPPPPPPPANSPPTAVNDSAATTINVPVTINVLANDTDPNNNIAPGTVAIVTPATLGNAVVNPDGTVTYTPRLGVTGLDSFQYHVSDATGLVSNTATVSVTTHVLRVTLAQFRLLANRWTITGTCTLVAPGSRVTIFNGNTVAGPVIGTAPIDANGAWTLDVRPSPISPDPTRTISVRSPLGTTVLGAPVSVRN